MNKLILIGNLTKEVEFKQFPATAIAVLNIAVNKRLKDKEEVLFLECKCFGKIAEVARDYLDKGSKVALDGRLVLEQWTTESGEKRSKYVMSVDTLEMLGKNETKSTQTTPSIGKMTEQEVMQRTKELVNKGYKKIELTKVEEDEIPF